MIYKLLILFLFLICVLGFFGAAQMALDSKCEPTLDHFSGRYLSLEK